MTIYDLAGVAPPIRIRGRSLLKHGLRGWALARVRHCHLSERTILITETNDGQRKLVMTRENGEARYSLSDLSHDGATSDAISTDEGDLDAMNDMMNDARVALEDRTELRIALF